MKIASAAQLSVRVNKGFVHVSAETVPDGQSILENQTPNHAEMLILTELAGMRAQIQLALTESQSFASFGGISSLLGAAMKLSASAASAVATFSKGENLLSDQKKNIRLSAADVQKFMETAKNAARSVVDPKMQALLTSIFHKLEAGLKVLNKLVPQPTKDGRFTKQATVKPQTDNKMSVANALRVAFQTAAKSTVARTLFRTATDVLAFATKGVTALSSKANGLSQPTAKVIPIAHIGARSISTVGLGLPTISRTNVTSIAPVTQVVTSVVSTAQPAHIAPSHAAPNVAATISSANVASIATATQVVTPIINTAQSAHTAPAQVALTTTATMTTQTLPASNLNSNVATVASLTPSQAVVHIAANTITPSQPIPTKVTTIQPIDTHRPIAPEQRQPLPEVQKLNPVAVEQTVVKSEPLRVIINRNDNAPPLNPLRSQQPQTTNFIEPEARHVSRHQGVPQVPTSQTKAFNPVGTPEPEKAPISSTTQRLAEKQSETILSTISTTIQDLFKMAKTQICHCGNCNGSGVVRNNNKGLGANLLESIKSVAQGMFCGSNCTCSREAKSAAASAMLAGMKMGPA